ncbi:MAG: DUF4230 domain-containing protein [Acidimicrobiia bacterium]|jgi:hypothetical protein|nr:DUF4230 domain-containing protein [Acidimicrobiia bacterium]
MSTLLEDRAREDRPLAAAPAQEVVVRVVADDRSGRTGAPRPSERRSERRPRRFTIRGAITTLVLGAIAIGIFLLVGALSGLLSFDPFSTTQVDRTPPVLLKQMQDLHQFRAARGTFEANVDVENDVGLVPSFIAGERTIFNAVGTVDANVDFSRLADDAVVLGTEGSITVTLPSPTYARPVVDPARSHVAARDRGLVDRIAGVFSDDPTSERDLYLLAGHKLGAAARESHLLARAEANTTTMLQGLLGKAGFTDVRVVFTRPAASATPAQR